MSETSSRAGSGFARAGSVAGDGLSVGDGLVVASDGFSMIWTSSSSTSSRALSSPPSRTITPPSTRTRARGGSGTATGFRPRFRARLDDWSRSPRRVWKHSPSTTSTLPANHFANARTCRISGSASFAREFEPSPRPANANAVSRGTAELATASTSGSFAAASIAAARAIRHKTCVLCVERSSARSSDVIRRAGPFDEEPPASASSSSSPAASSAAIISSSYSWTSSHSSAPSSAPPSAPSSPSSWISFAAAAAAATAARFASAAFAAAASASAAAAASSSSRWETAWAPHAPTRSGRVEGGGAHDPSVGLRRVPALAAAALPAFVARSAAADASASTAALCALAAAPRRDAPRAGPGAGAGWVAGARAARARDDATVAVAAVAVVAAARRDARFSRRALTLRTADDARVPSSSGVRAWVGSTRAGGARRGGIASRGLPCPGRDARAPRASSSATPRAPLARERPGSWRADVLRDLRRWRS